MGTNNPALIDQAVAVCRAAEDLGIRLAFVVPMRDRNRLGYIPDDVVLDRLPPVYRQQVQKRWLHDVLPPREQIQIADEIARRCSSPLVDVLYGPAAPHWCTNEMLEMVAEASAGNGRRVHMHCLETRYQREFADAAFPQGLFPFLKQVGMLTDRLTLAHGVELRSDEMDMIAEAGAVVSLNTCSNLRLRSGIAPAVEMAAHGVPLAIGIDALGFDDDEDGFSELRLAHLLHGGISFDKGLTKAELLEAALRNGGRAVTGRDGHGLLTPGAPADMVTLDFAKLARDVMPGVTPDLEVVLARATRTHVRSLIVAGIEIVADGKTLGVDEGAIEMEVISQAKAVAEHYRTAKPILELVQSTLRQCYLDGLHRSPAF
jgi:cytosine/adenosine deaminase-related metal-dependent hydrolase